LSSANSNSCSRSQTPAACQSRNRRQQVSPHPQPNSCGSIVHGMPLRKTNRIPVSASRLPTGGRPPLVEAITGGRSGWTRSHNASETNAFAMTVLLDRRSYKQTTSR
jgi:hypothetical protein